MPPDRPSLPDLRQGMVWAWLFLVLTAGPSLGEAADYIQHVKPILRDKCSSCHGRLKQKAGLRLDAGALVLRGSRDGAVLTPGRADDSELIRRVMSTDEDERMPPEGSPLTPDQVRLLADWINHGAVVPEDEAIPAAPAEHWAFQPLVRPSCPEVQDKAWCQNEIDRFILARLESQGWRPAPEAPASALRRRLYFDVLGLPPSPAEQEAAPLPLDETTWGSWVDDVLARPAYGERWARHWLDLVRYADSNGYERDAAKPFVWRYRDYVIRSLNADKRMDRFITEQIAGDELPDASAETLIATGFHRLGHWDDEPADPDTDRYDQLDDLVRTTSEVFLGLTLGCARCHDHKFEPLTTRDYYSMVAIFHPLERPRNGRTELTLPAASEADRESVAERDRQIAAIEREKETFQQAHLRDLLRSHSCGLPRETIDAWLTPAAERTSDQAQQVHDSAKEVLTQLAAHLPEDARAQWQAFDQAMENWRARVPDLPQGYFLHEPTPKAPATHILVRGSPHRLGEEVPPAVPGILAASATDFPPPGDRTSRRRLGLARWLVSTDNPLTARVLVNRVWQQHFGVGLVRTPSDFGLMGEPPTHPELLDWLAHWFMHDAHWSLKELHRLILTSRTWRMSRAPADPAYLARDPENRWMTHVAYRRLEVEAVRDAMLAVSGQWQGGMYGPPMFPLIPDQALEANTDRHSIWTASSEQERARRTIYAFIKRGLVVPMLEVMDLGDTVHSCPRRQVTTVAPQALTLFNGAFVNEQARHFARRVLLEAGPEPAQQIRRAWNLALSRAPTPPELERMTLFLREEEKAARQETDQDLAEADAREQALTQLCRVIFNLNEFVYPD